MYGFNGGGLGSELMVMAISSSVVCIVMAAVLKLQALLVWSVMI
jgi:hypothetical protein